MNSIWLSLLWKEWCEFRWKLAALAASFVVGQAILMGAFMRGSLHDLIAGLVVSMIFCLLVYAVLAGAFVGMSVAAGENSRRTMRFTQALPIPMWQAALIRLLIGLVTVVIPTVCVVSLIWVFTSYVWNDQVTVNLAVSQQFDELQNPWHIPNFFVSRAVACILGVTSLLLWVSSCGVNRADDVRAGAVAFLVCAVLWGVWIYGIGENVLGLRGLLETLSVALPGGPAFAGDFNYGGGPKDLKFLAAIALVSHAAVLSFFLMRYGRANARSHTGGRQFITDWLRFRGAGRPLRSQGLTIIWKQIHELGPLALLAVAGILAFLACAYVADDGQRWSARNWGDILAGVTLAVAGLVTLIAGIGVMYEDYSRGLSNFWRSRPINLHQWFFLKYLAGILVLVIAFVPLILVAGRLNDWNLTTTSDIAKFVVIYLTLYTGSLAAYALVRQPIYAVVLTIAGIWFTPGVLLFIRPLLPYGEPDEERFMLVLFAFEAIAATLLAWQAVVRDWGWKQHR
jgi:ABC-type transport system involved in multi-copper enzyme maturation permease subunit